jgi:hypothetical protein
VCRIRSIVLRRIGRFPEPAQRFATAFQPDAMKPGEGFKVS